MRMVLPQRCRRLIAPYQTHLRQTPLVTFRPVSKSSTAPVLRHRVRHDPEGIEDNPTTPNYVPLDPVWKRGSLKGKMRDCPSQNNPPPATNRQLSRPPSGRGHGLRPPHGAITGAEGNAAFRRFACASRESWAAASAKETSAPPHRIFCQRPLKRPKLARPFALERTAIVTAEKEARKPPEELRDRAAKHRHVAKKTKSEEEHPKRPLE